MKTWILPLFLALPSCSWTFDGEALDISLDEGAPPLSTPRRLNRQPLIGASISHGAFGSSYYVMGIRERYWLLLYERPGAPLRQALRLPDLLVEHVFDAARVYQTGASSSMVAQVRPQGDGKRLSYGAIDEDPATHRSYLLPGTSEQLDFRGDEGAILHLSGRARFQVIEGAAVHDLPWPEGLGAPRFPDGRQPVVLQEDPAGRRTLLRYYQDEPLTEVVLQDLAPGALRRWATFSGFVVMQDEMGAFFSYDLAGRRLVGPFPYVVRDPGQQGKREIQHDPLRRAMLVCDADGLRSLPYDDPAQPVRALDNAPCDSTLRIGIEYVVYLPIVGGLRRVRTDGSGTPEPFMMPPGGGQQEEPRQGDVIDRCGELVARRRAAEIIPNEVGGFAEVGEGWIGERRFMERGSYAGFSADCRRIRFFEFGQRRDGLGELRSLRLSDWEMLRIGRDASYFYELPDGRLIALTHMLTFGPHNRLLLVDEEQRSARRLIADPSFLDTPELLSWRRVYYNMLGHPDPLFVVEVFSVPPGQEARPDTPFDLYHIPIPPP